MINSNQLLGVILAGGLSRRMDGDEKSLMPLGSKSLITHVVSRLNTQLSEILLNANGDATRFDFLNLPIQADTVEGFAGPLAGVLAGMNWAIQHRPDMTHIITVASDTPFFPEEYVISMLQEANEKQAHIALAGSNDRHHPVFGLWPISLHDELQKFLIDEGNRKVMLFVERYANCRVDFQANEVDPFFNVNTPEDLAQANRLLELS